MRVQQWSASGAIGYRRLGVGIDGKGKAHQISGRLGSEKRGVEPGHPREEGRRMDDEGRSRRWRFRGEDWGDS